MLIDTGVVVATGEPIAVDTKVETHVEQLAMCMIQEV